MARKLVWIAFWFVVVWLLGGKEITNKIWLKYFPVEESHYFEKAEKYCFNQTCLEQIEGKWWVDDGKTKIPADEKLAEEYQNKIEGINLEEVAVTNKENFGPLGIGDGEEVWLSVNGKKLEIGKITSSYDGTWVRPEGEEVVYRPEVVIDNGQLVADDLVNQMVVDRIKKNDCQAGFILDGYPRTEEQVEFLEKISNIDYVFLIEIKDEMIIERISGRRTCKNGHSWHIKYSPTKKDGLCDICGEELYVRDDDNEEKVKERLRIYHQNHDPILNYYNQKEKLIIVNGDQHIEGVFQDLIKYLVDDLRRKMR